MSGYHGLHQVATFDKCLTHANLKYFILSSIITAGGWRTSA